VGPAGLPPQADKLPSDPLIMNLLFSNSYLILKSQSILVIFNINRGLCFHTCKINCSFYVKYYTGLYGFAGKLAKKLAHFSIS
jgi:hypothetical protein